MTLLAILLALLAERLASHYRDRHLYDHRGGLLRKLRERLPSEALWQSPIWPALILLVPVIGLATLRGFVAGSPLRALFDAAVLFLCLGPRDLADDIHRLVEARENGDGATVRRITHTLMRGPMPDTDTRSLIGALFIQSHERLFGILLWFIVAGPAGAAFYRIASRLPRVQQSFDGAATRFARYVHAAAAWVPARLTAALYGLAGSTDDALKAWHSLPDDLSWVQRTWTLLADVASNALDFEEHGARVVPARLELALAEVLRMQRRALLVVLAVFALYSAGAWLA